MSTSANKHTDQPIIAVFAFKQKGVHWHCNF